MAVNACANTPRVGPATQVRPWPTYLGSARRSPAAADAPGEAPQPVWRIDVGRGIVGAPALTEDVVAVSQVDRQVALLARGTGAVFWRARLPSPPGAGPLVDGDRVLVATTEALGRVFALRLENGSRIWSAKAGDVAAPLMVSDSVVYAGTTTGEVLALRERDGSSIWRARLPGAVRATPLRVPTGLVVATATDSVFLLDSRTGAVRVRRAVGGTVLGGAAFDSLIVAGTTAVELVALRPDSLAVAWRLELGAGVVGSVALQGGTAWALDARGTLWRVPLDDIAAATHVATGVVSRAGPAPTASGVLLASVEGDLVLVDPSTGARRWSASVQAPLEQPPLVDGSSLFIAAARGVVMAFR